MSLFRAFMAALAAFIFPAVIHTIYHRDDGATLLGSVLLALAVFFAAFKSTP